MKFIHVLLFCCLVNIGSCKIHYNITSQEPKLYKIESKSISDSLSDIELLLVPYRDSMSGLMNEVLGSCEGDLEKNRPNGSLGNMVADAILEFAQALQPLTSVSICNYGGLRIPEIKKGPITRGKIYELMPFDNELVILELTSQQLIQFLNLIAESGGWPVASSEKLSFQFKNNKLETCVESNPNGIVKQFKNEEFFTNEKVFYAATSDYIANGGDNCEFLKACKRTNTGVLIRDILINFVATRKVILPNNFQTLKL